MFNFCCVPPIQRARFNAEGGCHSLDSPFQPCEPDVVWIVKDTDTLNAGNSVHERLDPLATNLRLECAEPSDVASRFRKALHEPGPHRIDDDDKDDGYPLVPRDAERSGPGCR